MKALVRNEIRRLFQEPILGFGVIAKPITDFRLPGPSPE